MAEQCEIPNAVEKILAASHCGVAFLGGSLTVGVGASDVSRTSWRALFTRHLYEQYQPVYHCQPSEIMGAIGAIESFVTAFTLERNVLPAQPDLAFVEFCVNDRWTADKTLVGKGVEGIVRQLLAAKGSCNVVLVGTGDRQASVDHALHRRVAEHYGLPFIDMQGYMHARLKERGETWDAASIDFEANDNLHLNDYGNRLCFEAMRDCFEEQVRLFRDGRKRPRKVPLPEPLFSDELQFARLVDVSRKSRALSIEGDWELKDRGHIPWYFDHLMVGKPGARMTLAFRGTAVSVFGLMHHNGLKLEAELDGQEIAGPYLRHFIEFGKGMILAHGLPDGEHVLKLTVAEPSKRHNKLAEPAAQIAFIGVAGKPSGAEAAG